MNVVAMGGVAASWRSSSSLSAFMTENCCGGFAIMFFMNASRMRLHCIVLACHASIVVHAIVQADMFFVTFLCGDTFHFGAGLGQP